MRVEESILTRVTQCYLENSSARNRSAWREKAPRISGQYN